jgi:hypothetical protein
MHDWGDDKCRSILTHIVEAMNPNHSRVLIVDVVSIELESLSSLQMLTNVAKGPSE